MTGCLFDRAEGMGGVDRMRGSAVAGAIRVAGGGRQAAVTKNWALLRTIAAHEPKSVPELAAMSGRTQQSVLCTVNKRAAVGGPCA
jgi:hypothetical protein